MKFNRPLETSATGIAHTLLLSCPNEGGLIALHNGRAMIIDHVDTTGIHASPEMVIRGHQTADHAFIDIFTKDTVRSMVLKEVNDLHDILVIGERMHVVSTGTNEVLVYDLSGRLLERIPYPGQSDSWHLNCLARSPDGRLAITAFGKFSEFREWKGRSAGQGFIGFLGDTTGSQNILEGLNKPHTPRFHQGDIYCCDSDNNSLVRIRNGRKESLPIDHRFTRGLALCGDIAYVGLSGWRSLAKGPSTGGIAVVNLKQFRVETIFDIPLNEVYDVMAISEAQLESISLHYLNSKISRHSHELYALKLPSKISAPEISASANEESVLLAKQLGQLQQRYNATLLQLDILHDRLTRQTRSFSWKATAPLRWARRHMNSFLLRK
ncbi:DUF4915 domain-containing protein [Rariglobus hedericola]|uniref:DUF4915 domain-containing protein n=1 Tax=Rariglobus hedericola TaxID=2597822 RepID=A0A556QJ35_9BACT|nr:DUF4915 domain-containing protein [Rariglobus hedericola]TSJ76664.1 DUF4915 domain-containing protein [Rariglobus hedericola]